MDQRLKTIAAVVAAALVVGGAIAFALSGRGVPDPEPTAPGGPGIGVPTVLPPVDPSATPEPTQEPTGEPSSTPDTTDPHEVVISGDGDADGYLPGTVWTEAPESDPDHDDLHAGEEDETTQWLPSVEAFAAAFANTERPHDAWLADIAPHLSARLASVYADPATKDALSATKLSEVRVAYGGETTGRALVRYENWRMDLYVTVGPSATSPSGWEITTIEKA